MSLPQWAASAERLRRDARLAERRKLAAQLFPGLMHEACARLDPERGYHYADRDQALRDAFDLAGKLQDME